MEDARPIRFTGHWRDFNAADDSFDDLDYMHARYYMPTRGRFLSVDPASRSFHLENPDSFNRYTYALNNPVKYVDPDGEYWETALDVASFIASHKAWMRASTDFMDQPSWASGLNAGRALIENVADGLAVLTPFPAIFGHIQTAQYAVKSRAAVDEVMSAPGKFLTRSKGRNICERSSNAEDADREFDRLTNGLEIKSRTDRPGLRWTTHKDGTTVSVRLGGGKKK